jgi:hypothetical protein
MQRFNSFECQQTKQSGMKLFMTLLLFQLLLITSFCQRIEFNLNVYSGVFFYKGNGSASSSTINYGIYLPAPYTSNVYGRKSGFPISFEAQVVKDTRSNFLYGLGVSYDLLNSKIKIDKAQFSPEVIEINQSYLYDAGGNTKLKNAYFNLNPFIGKRFLKTKMTFDVLGGFDFGMCLKSLEEGDATIGSTKVKVHSNVSKPYPSIDFRPRIQFKAGRKRIGIMIGYSLGLTNYHRQDTSKACTRFLRFGFCYRIK